MHLLSDALLSRLLAETAVIAFHLLHAQFIGTVCFDFSTYNQLFCCYE